MENLVVLKRSDLQELISEAVTEAIVTNRPTKKENTKKTLFIDEAVTYLNENGYPIAKSSIYKLTSTGQIPFRRFGGRKILFRVSELNEWIEEQLSNRGNEITDNVARSARRKQL